MVFLHNEQGEGVGTEKEEILDIYPGAAGQAHDEDHGQGPHPRQGEG